MYEGYYILKPDTLSGVLYDHIIFARQAYMKTVIVFASEANCTEFIESMKQYCPTYRWITEDHIQDSAGRILLHCLEDGAGQIEIPPSEIVLIDEDIFRMDESVRIRHLGGNRVPLRFELASYCFQVCDSVVDGVRYIDLCPDKPKRADDCAVSEELQAWLDSLSAERHP